VTVRVRRIVVAIDASPVSLAAVEASVELAARWDVEITGLFVEDVNLLRWGSLPFAREVGSFTAAVRPLRPPEVERRLRLQAGEARRALEAAARHLSVRVSFHTVRGAVAEQLLATLTEQDLLTVGTRGWAARAGWGSTARALAAAAPAHVLLLPRAAPPRAPVAAVYDGSAAGREALTIARDLAAGRLEDLRILCVATAEQDAAALAQDAASVLEDTERTARYASVATPRRSSVGRVARTLGARTLVLPVGSPGLADLAVEQLAEDFAGPVVLIRRE
jgi:hypothetical protein